MMTTQEYIKYQLSQGVPEEEVMKMVKKKEGKQKAESEMLLAKCHFGDLFGLK